MIVQNGHSQESSLVLGEIEIELCNVVIEVNRSWSIEAKSTRIQTVALGRIVARIL